MDIYRICKVNFLKDLSGEGARLYGGRWNHKGVSMLYFSSHISLALLEFLCNAGDNFNTSSVGILHCTIPEGDISVVPVNSLPSDWSDYPAPSSSKNIGTDWIRKGKTLALKVPSSLVPQEFNILLNPHHPSISHLKVIHSEPFMVSERIKDLA